MSSPLDGRIRAIARAEVEALLDSIKSPSAEMAGAGAPVSASLMAGAGAPVSASLMAGAGAPVSASLANGLTPTQEMQQQITDLHEHLHQAATTISRLEARLEVLEKGATAPAPVKRTARKATADPSEETAESSK